MPEKTTLSLSSPMEDEEMEQSSTEKKINNLTKVRIVQISIEIQRKLIYLSN